MYWPILTRYLEARDEVLQYLLLLILAQVIVGYKLGPRLELFIEGIDTLIGEY